MSEAEREAEAPAPSEEEGVGETLRRVRTARGLSIDQVATELRIEARQLVALEDERFAEIGPSVFVKGYLKHYSQLLGLEYGELLGRYQRQGAPPEVVLQPSRTIKLRNERQITSWVIAALVLAAVVAVLVLWWRGEGLAFLEGTFGTRMPQGSALSSTFSSKLSD